MAEHVVRREWPPGHRPAGAEVGVMIQDDLGCSLYTELLTLADDSTTVLRLPVPDGAHAITLVLPRHPDGTALPADRPPRTVGG